MVSFVFTGLSQALPTGCQLRVFFGQRAGARQSKACALLGISCQTLRRWRNAASLIDQRTCPKPKTYPHALSHIEKIAMIAICNSEEYKSLPPSQIVPRLADKGLYLASESSFYRVLKEDIFQHHRGRSKTPHKPSASASLHARCPKQAWSWDITFLPSSIRGQFYRLYMVMDIYSRYIVGWFNRLYGSPDDYGNTSFNRNMAVGTRVWLKAR